MTLDEVYDTYLQVVGHYRVGAPLKAEKNASHYESFVRKLGKDFNDKRSLETFIASVCAGQGPIHLTSIVQDYDNLFQKYYIPRKKFDTDPVRYCLEDAKKMCEISTLSGHIKEPKWLVRNMRSRHHK